MSRTTTPPELLESGGTRITVQRCCSFCGDELGDATAAEMELAIAGLELPDTAEEHGCHAHHFVPVSDGRFAGSTAYVQRCSCSLTLRQYNDRGHTE